MKKTLASMIGWLILLILIGGSVFLTMWASGQEFFNWSGVLFWLLVFLFIIFILIYIYQRWYFDVYFYDLAPDFVQIKKGPITPTEITIPYERIQDVYVDQDILDRIFGLYDVHLSSATASSGMEAHIDGVERQSAEGLRTILLETVKQKISKDRFINSQIT